MRRFMTRQAVLSVFLSISLLPAVVQAEYKVFFGNLHSHTSFSDGSGKPDEAYQYAKDTGKLDFMAITEHNHKDAESGAKPDRRDGILIAKDTKLYTGPRTDAVIPSANRRTKSGQFVALYGQEFSTIKSGNHVGVFDVPEVIDVPKGAFRQLAQWMEAHRDSTGALPIVQFHHPGDFNDPMVEYGADDFASQEEWITTMDRFVRLIEMVVGPAMTKGSGMDPGSPAERDYVHYLSLGFHVGPTANQDNHYRTWGTATRARTGVLADSLTKASILEALRERRVFATEDENLQVQFKVNGHIMGEHFLPTMNIGDELDIQVALRDKDEPNATYEVEVVRGFIGITPGQEFRETFTLNGNTPAGTFVLLDGVQYTHANQFVFLKVKQLQEDGQPDRAWTAPVWLEQNAPGSQPFSPGPKVRMVSLLPDPPGNDAQDEEITIRNLGLLPVDLTGWTLRDLSRHTWSLDNLGSLNPDAEKTIKRSGQPMSLNNGGDTIELLAADGIVVQTVTYPAIQPGQVFKP